MLNIVVEATVYWSKIDKKYAVYRIITEWVRLLFLEAE